MKLEKDEKRLGQYDDIKKKIEAQMRAEGQEVKGESSEKKQRAISDLRKFEKDEDQEAVLIQPMMNDRDYVAATVTAWNACPGVVKK